MPFPQIWEGFGQAGHRTGVLSHDLATTLSSQDPRSRSQRFIDEEPILGGRTLTAGGAARAKATLL